MMRWKVVGWHSGEPCLIELSTGLLLETPDHADAEYWETGLHIECSDDCENAGWIIGDDDCYCDPNDPDNDDPPTRWRSIATLPHWFKAAYPIVFGEVVK